MKKEDIQRFPPIPARLKDSSQVVLRMLSPEDGPALGDFYEAVPHEFTRFYSPYPLTREQGALNAAAAYDPRAAVLVMETPDRRIGGYAWFRWASDEASRSTFGICLSREFQGRGVGRALMERLLEIARGIGPVVMGLTVQLANERAVRLYKQMGFVVIRQQMRAPEPHCDFPSEPEYYMERSAR